MMNLILAQFKAMGFDPEVARDQIAKAVGDIRAMKESQDRTEAMVRAMYEIEFADPNAIPANITVSKAVVLGKAAP